MKEILLDLEAPELLPGLVGLVEGVAHLMGAQADELLGMSSAAFCNYVFDPKFNQHEPVRREFSPHAGLFSNYGPWASISYFTGWELLEVNGHSAVETLKVVAFELGEGRSMITLTPSLEPTLVLGTRIGVDERVVLTQHGEVTVRDEQRLQGDDEVFRNWILLVRPSEVPEWATPAVRQQVNVLRWAVEHANNPQREFFQETRENYAPGLQGVVRFRELLVGLTDLATIEYAEGYVRALQRAREAASSCLTRWAEPIAEDLGAPGVRRALELAAEAYAAASRALVESPNFADAMAEVEAHERAAIAALNVAARHFPAQFEAS